MCLPSRVVTRFGAPESGVYLVGACALPMASARPHRPGMSSNSIRPNLAGSTGATTRSSPTRYPVLYPTACSPQAWSTGTVLLFLRTMLGMEPRGDHLVNRPAVPASVGRIELLDIPGRWGRADALGRSRSG